jgi:hypothetical protein
MRWLDLHHRQHAHGRKCIGRIQHICADNEMQVRTCDYCIKAKCFALM